MKTFYDMNMRSFKIQTDNIAIDGVKEFKSKNPTAS